MANTPWIGGANDKLFLQSGQFTSTVKTSETVSSIDNLSTGISYDGTDTPWSGAEARKLYLQSGQFTSTLKTSEDISAIDIVPNDISYNGNDTPWCGSNDDKLYLQSGQFSSTLLASESIIGIDIAPTGISWDGTNTPWSGTESDKLFLQSGQFTSTLKTSRAVGGIDVSPTGISYDGANTPWSGADADKLYLQSGQFSSTLLTSQAVGGLDTTPIGIDTDDVIARLGGIPANVAPSQQSLVLALPVPTIGIITNPTMLLSVLAISLALPVPLVIIDSTALISSPLLLSMTQESASVLLTQIVIISAPLSLSMAHQSPSAISDANMIIAVPLGLTGTLPIPSQHGDANINISEPLAMATQIFTLSILIDGSLFVIIVPDEALELSGANPSPSITVHANIEVEPLLLSMDIDLQPLTFVIGGEVFVSLPVLPLSFAINAVVVISDTFILLPGIAVPGLEMSLSLHAPEISVTDDVKIIVTNARTFAISEYTAMAFNSMAKFNGKYLYAKADGIYEGGGNDDNGAGIHASYKTGAFNIDATEVQKLRNAFLNFRSNGDMQLFSVGNEVNTRLYNIPNSTADTMHERRKKFERGIRDNHFSFGISNVAGSSFEIKSAKILTEPIRKRR
jgi:hypothetical protein